MPQYLAAGFSLRLAPFAGDVTTNMQDAGIALMESFDADVHDSFIDRTEFGIRMNMGAGDHKVYDNVFNDISSGEVCTNFQVQCYPAPEVDLICSMS